MSNREKEKAQARKWAQKNRDAAKNQQYRHRAKYGLEPEDYEYIYETQGGKCGICRTVDRLYVDHCHSTGRVRGLLCHQCNIGLGNFKDDIKRLGDAIRYLDR